MGTRKAGTKERKALTLLDGVRHVRVEGMTDGRPRLLRLFYTSDSYDVTDDMVEVSPEKKSDDGFESPVDL